MVSEPHLRHPLRGTARVDNLHTTTSHFGRPCHVTVKDSGFGNVLDGLEFNNTATAILGNEAVTFGLENAGPAVRAFRACTAGAGA